MPNIVKSSSCRNKLLIIWKLYIVHKLKFLDVSYQSNSKFEWNCSLSEIEKLFWMKDKKV